MKYRRVWVGCGYCEWRVASWRLGVDGGEWGGECLCGNLAKRTKRERGKKEFGIGLVVRGKSFEPQRR